MITTNPLVPQLTVVMYHYVRPVAQSPFSHLKALEISDFIGQINWLEYHYNMISPRDLSAALGSGTALPPRSCLLTFDDGYQDHFSHVFPELMTRGIEGLFFAPCSSLVERRVLEVNKIQFVLASQDQPDALADELDAMLWQSGLADSAQLRAAHFTPNRFDTAEVAYVKRLLQHVLPADVRSTALNRLFCRHVSADETAFAEELYLTPDQAAEMRAQGMEFGGHGDLHLWHDQCSAEELQGEVSGSVRALSQIGAPVEGGFYCYPFGSQSAMVRSAVEKAGFKMGFTTEPSLADFSLGGSLQIPRLDTRDLPCGAVTTASPWLENRIDGSSVSGGPVGT